MWQRNEPKLQRRPFLLQSKRPFQNAFTIRRALGQPITRVLMSSTPAPTIGSVVKTGLSPPSSVCP